MNRLFQAVGFALAAFGLFACNQPDKIAAPHSQTGKGSAHLRLPTIPADYLAKTAAGSPSKAVFSLTISGNGMAPIYQSWVLTPGQSQSAYIGDIPVGYRVFYGRLIKMDTAFGDTSVTHEGSDSAWIERDSITDVNLFLRNAGGGTAHVCVEVEGWPTDSTCYKPPIPVPEYPRFDGCWNLSVLKKGATSLQDSVFKAKLRIEQWDSTVFGVVTWNSGARDTARGRIYGSTILLENGNIAGQFTLKADLTVSMVDTLNPIELRGFFAAFARGISGTATGSRSLCDTLIPPIDTVYVPIDSNASCWSVWQKLDNGAYHTGTLSLVRTDSAAWGALNWNGFPEMRVTNGNAPPLDPTLYLYGDLPPGMTDVPNGVVHHAHYKAKIGPSSLDAGAVYSTWMPGEFTSGDHFGSWGGKPMPCIDRRPDVIHYHPLLLIRNPRAGGPPGPLYSPRLGSSISP